MLPIITPLTGKLKCDVCAESTAGQCCTWTHMFMYAFTSGFYHQLMWQFCFHVFSTTLRVQKRISTCCVSVMCIFGGYTEQPVIVVRHQG